MDSAQAAPRCTPVSTRTQLVLASCACAGATAFLYAVEPNAHSVYPRCLFYQATGFYCAGCGMTRALHALLHGRILEALHDNALFITAIPLLLWLAVPHLIRAWKENAWPVADIPGKSLIRLGIALVGLMVAFMALRNLPGWPFDWLKPVAATG